MAFTAGGAVPRLQEKLISREFYEYYYSQHMHGRGTSNTVNIIMCS